MTLRALVRPLVRRIGQHAVALDPTGMLASYMTTPPTALRKTSIRTMIAALQTAGAWNGVDQLYMRAAADVQTSRLNWHSAPSTPIAQVASPTFTADRFITYNGTTQYEYSPGFQSVFNGAVNLPDGPGGDPGKGFTCTGLMRDPSTGTWWVGDDGRHTEAAPGTRQAAILRLSADFTTIVQTIDIQTLFPTVGTIQGVAYDTSDDTLWFASTDENLIRHITKTGGNLGTIAFTGANGLAYDALTDCLVTAASSGAAGTASWLRCSDGTTLKTKSIRTNADQFYFDPSSGTEGALYYSDGSNTQAAWVEKIDVATNAWQGAWSLPEATAIEGIYLLNGILYVTNDAYFHNGPSFFNQALTYSTEALSGSASDRIILAGTARYATSPAATLCLLAGGEPLAGFGVGLYAPSGGTVLRMILATSAGTQITVNWTVTITTRFSFWLDVDLTAKTAALYINGALVSSQSIAAAGASLPRMSWFFGASPDIPVARFSNAELSSFMTGRGASLAAARTSWDAAQSAYFADVGLTVP